MSRRKTKTSDFSLAFDREYDREDLYYRKGGLDFLPVGDDEVTASGKKYRTYPTGMVIGDQDLEKFMEINVATEFREGTDSEARTKSEWKKEMLGDYLEFADIDRSPENEGEIKKARRAIKQIWDTKEDIEYKELAEVIHRTAENTNVSVFDAEQSVLTQFVKTTYCKDLEQGQLITQDYGLGPVEFNELPWRPKEQFGINAPYVETFSFRNEYGDAYMGGL